MPIEEFDFGEEDKTLSAISGILEGGLEGFLSSRAFEQKERELANALAEKKQKAEFELKKFDEQTEKEKREFEFKSTPSDVTFGGRTANVIPSAQPSAIAGLASINKADVAGRTAFTKDALNIANKLVPEAEGFLGLPATEQQKAERERKLFDFASFAEHAMKSGLISPDKIKQLLAPDEGDSKVKIPGQKRGKKQGKEERQRAMANRLRAAKERRDKKK